jgi:hypothetical protein
MKMASATRRKYCFRMDDLRRDLIRAEIAERVARARVDLEVAAELAFMDRRLAGAERLRTRLLELAARLQGLQEIVSSKAPIAGDS